MDYIATILGAVYPDGRDAFLWARDKMPSSYMSGNPHAVKMWDFTEKYVDRFSSMPSPKVMKDFIEKTQDAGTAALMYQLYATAASASVPLADFKYAVEAVCDAATKNKTGEIIATGFEILEQGYVVNGERVEGHAAAREFISSGLASLEKEMQVASTPEGDVLSEGDKILADYKKAKEEDHEGEIPTGFPTVDKTIGGLRPGDLTLIASYTSGGKSMMCVDLSYRAAVENGKGVFYATTETTRTQIRSRFLARHSRHKKFNLPGGLDHSLITRGALNSRGEQVLHDVIEDLSSNASYGRFHIAQLPSKPTLSYIERRMLKEQQSWNIDMLTVDSLNLLRPEDKRSTQREELVSILVAAQSLSSSYNGTGIIILSPWQINRNGFDKARTSQSYELVDLAEASEAEKSADYIFSLYYDAQQSTKTATLQSLKTRGTAMPPRITLNVDYRNAYFAESSGANAEAFTQNISSGSGKVNGLGIAL